MPDTNAPPPLAAYSIVPWVRRGLASQIAGTHTTNYASLPVSLVVNDAAVSVPSVRLLGPGDITSLDARAIIRTDPSDGADAFEPNYLATVELVLPDLPWMFTPAAPANGRLRPWICLIVVPDTQGATLQVPPGGPAILRLDSPLDPRTELPNLDQIDAWAHAQVTGDKVSGAALNTALDGNSTARLSRLIAPRKLDAGKRYIACVVPTYRAGVNAGLGLAVDDNDLAPAWDANTQAPFSLPVYYYFRFQTGSDGDFASLARRIHPPNAPLEAGARKIDASAPGFGLAPMAGVSLDLEGALRAVGSQPKPWPAGAQATYAGELRQALVPPPAPGPMVSPPTYGCTQSGSDLSANNAPPVWLGQLNLDPTTRAAAGAGAQVVQRDQDALIASAWDQLGEIRKANQLLRQAQLAREVSASLNQRHLQTVSGDGIYLQITAPLHSRVSLALNGVNATLRSQLETSRIPNGAVSPVLRKLARPRGAIGRSLNERGTSQIVDRLNLPAGDGKALVVAGPTQAPRGMVAFDDVSSTFQVNRITTAALQTASGWKTSVLASPVALPVASPVASPPAAPVAPAHPVEPLIPEHPIAPVAPPAAPPLVNLADDPDAPDLLKGVRTNLPPPLAFPSDQAGLAKMQENFRSAASAIGGFINAASLPVAPDAPPLGGASELAPVRAQLVARINPEGTIRARVRARVPLGSGPDPLQPISAGPQFPQPMYSALAELSAEWMLPGVSNVLMDTAALLETNPRFVEAFLVGLNEEFARELLWREYPADRTGTFFRTFWGATVNGSPAPDIPPIATFDATGHLGDHMADHTTGGRLVLLIRAELFRRYPNALVSAAPARWNSDKITRGLGTPRQWPIFRGEIGSDIYFFGFDIDDPKGSNDPADGKPGWYFLIEEHSTEPRFGLEPKVSTPQDGSWNELSWNDSDVVLDHGFLNPASTLSVPSREGVGWGQDGAAMAYILMRRPVRVALHGRALLGGA
jgi:hypothetical protein